MARFALFSDVHANLPALEAVLRAIAQERDLAGTYHPGDLVGYAPWPNETVGLPRTHHIQGIAGNYDSTVASDSKHGGCRYEDARQEALSHVSYDRSTRPESTLSISRAAATTSPPFLFVCGTKNAWRLPGSLLKRGRQTRARGIR
jgi:predicted phosphodiesterase